MDKQSFSRPLDVKNVRVTDGFWHAAQETVRTQMIPYQWEALNDRVEGAEPSYCMHNFRAAARLMAAKRENPVGFAEPSYTFRGFRVLPEDPARPDPDKFYGFVFQDSDFSKWIEAAAYSLAQHPDPQLEATVDGAIDTVCAAQHESGYLDTYYIINGMDGAFTNLRDNHELYCLGHLTEAAVAYYQATGKDKLLQAACRFASGMALTLSSGLNPERSMELVSALNDDPLYQEKLESCRKKMDEGQDLSEALHETGMFAGIYARMASIGSITGSMDQVMDRIAELYQDEIDNRMNTALAVLEPTLVIALSLIVGVILLSVMLPLMGIMSSL